MPLISGRKIGETYEPGKEPMSPVKEMSLLASPPSIQKISTPKAMNNRPEESGLGAVLRNLGSASAKTIGNFGALVNAPETLSNALLQPLLGKAYTASTGNNFDYNDLNRLAHKEGYGRSPLETLPEQLLGSEFLRPRNSSEQLLQNFLSQAPLALGGGVLQQSGKAIGHALARTGIGNVASHALKEKELPVWAQAIGQVGTEFLYGFLQKGGRPGALRKIAQKQLVKDDISRKKLASKISVPADNLEAYLNKQLLNMETSGLEKSLEREVRTQINRAGKDIYQDHINVGSALKRQDHLRILASQEQNDLARKLYNDAADAISETVIKPAINKSTNFGRFQSRYADLYNGLEAPSVVREILEENTKLANLLKNPLAKIAVLGGSLAKAGIPGAIGAAGLSVGARNLARTQDFFSKSKTANHALQRIVTSAIREDQPALAKALREINSAADLYEKENPEEVVTENVTKSNTPVRGKLVSGRRVNEE